MQKLQESIDNLYRFRLQVSDPGDTLVESCCNTVIGEYLVSRLDVVSGKVATGEDTKLQMTPIYGILSVKSKFSFPFDIT